MSLTYIISNSTSEHLQGLTAKGTKENQKYECQSAHPVMQPVKETTSDSLVTETKLNIRVRQRVVKSYYASG